MELDLLCCPICYETFNPTDRLPKLIPACGHTICKICLKTLLSSSSSTIVKCPLDKKPLDFKLDKVDTLPSNQLIMQIWEEDTQKELCRIHNEVVTFFCFTDQSKICDHCICTGTHKKHKTKPVKAAKKEAHNIRKLMDELCNSFEKYHKKIDEKVDDIQSKAIDAIRHEFANIKQMISNKENDIIAELNSAFFTEKWKISEVVGSCSKIRKNIESMLRDLANVAKSEDYIKNDGFFGDAQEYIGKYRALLNLETVQPAIQTIESNLQEICKTFQTNIAPEANFLNNVKMCFTIDLSTELHKILYGDIKEEDSSKKESPITSFTTESHFNISFKDSLLEIVNKESLFKSAVDLEQWKGVETIQLSLLHEVSTDSDFHLLDFIWQNLPEAANLKLKFDNNSISKKVADIMVRGTKQLSSIEIDLENYNLTGKSHVTPMICGILRAANAKNITLKLKKAILNDDILKTIVTVGIPNKSIIERFSLILEKTEVKDKHLEALQVAMPNMRHFTLNLSGTKITDGVLNGLIEQTFCTMKHLENFRLLLSGTQVTDKPFRLLMPLLVNLNKLCLNLTDTKATDSVVNYLAEIMPHLGPNLQDLMLGFSSQYISDKIIAPIFVSMPKVKSFALGLSGTLTSDRTIEAFVQNALSTMEALETLKLWVHRTKVTNSSFNLLIENLSNLKSLELGFASTNISEPPVEKLINEKLPNMTNLTDFKLDITNALIKSTILKDKVNNLNKKFAEKKKKK